MTPYEIREEMMGGEKHWMLYARLPIGWAFFERWNTPESAAARLKELAPRDAPNRKNWDNWSEDLRERPMAGEK